MTNATSGNMVAATSQIDDLDAIMKRFGITQEQALDGSIPAAYQKQNIRPINIRKHSW